MLHVREKENSDIVQAKMKLNTSVKACLKAMPSRMVLECMLLKQLHRYVFMIHVGARCVSLCTSTDNMMDNMMNMMNIYERVIFYLMWTYKDESDQY